MSRFAKKTQKGLPPISTASLPDIVFMLIFFFMVVTVIKEVNYKVDIKLPKASEISKLDKQDLINYIYVGKPNKNNMKVYGTQTRIQLDDSFAEVHQIKEYITAKVENLDEEKKKKMTTSLKIDIATKMGIVTAIKHELRKMNALKISYATNIEKVK